MSSDQQLVTEISRQATRLAVQLQECHRDLQARRKVDGQPVVQSARGAIERLLRDLQSIPRS